MKQGKINTIIEVCDVRHTFNQGCRRCQFNGIDCNRVKQILKVSIPFEYLDRKENNNLRKAGFRDDKF